MRTGPRHPRLAAAGYRLLRPLLERFYASRSLYTSTSRHAVAKLIDMRARLDRGDTVYLAGVGPAGLHNSGVGLIEVSREHGPRIVCNNEEERFSGEKHSTDFPRHALASLTTTMDQIGIGPESICAWLGTWDYSAFAAMVVRTMLEEFPASLSLLGTRETPFMNASQLAPSLRGPRHLARAINLPEPV
ncbi:MAG TPA: carbamoyltransferase, partial [Casimicrobiaceae bacterium]